LVLRSELDTRADELQRQANDVRDRFEARVREFKRFMDRVSGRADISDQELARLRSEQESQRVSHEAALQDALEEAAREREASEAARRAGEHVEHLLRNKMSTEIAAAATHQKQLEEEWNQAKDDLEADLGTA